MKREIKITADGSSTIHLPDWGESYHSTHGAIQEAKHVFLKQGFDVFNKERLSILEIGFGTGLNCFLTYLQATKQDVVVKYTGVEAYPVEKEEIQQLNYIQELAAFETKEIFEQMHACPWEEKQTLSKQFTLTKRKQFFKEITDINTFDLIYFDAFGAEYQPELWTEIIFKKMFEALKVNGILVTYSAKGSVRRAMIAVGFEVERLQGPPGKREMLRARKILS